MPLLFSYGTLQDPAVQQKTLGRCPAARPDVLPNYARAVNGPFFNAVPDPQCSLPGVVLDLTDDELLAIDAYEARDGYRRTPVVLRSGAEAWLYAAI
jgi:hypothetical protein